MSPRVTRSVALTAGLLLVASGVWLGLLSRCAQHVEAGAARPVRALEGPRDPTTAGDANVALSSASRRAAETNESSSAASDDEWSVYDFATGAPIPGAAIAWLDRTGRPLAAGDGATALTDERGLVAGPGVPAATARLSHAGHFARTIDVRGASSETRRIGLYPRSRLRLWLSDERGEPVAGARVELRCEASDLAGGERLNFEMSRDLGETGADGSCGGPDVPGGQTLHLQIDGEPHRARASATAATTEVRIQLEPRARLHGRLVREVDGMPAASTLVRLDMSGADQRRARTDAEGAFCFERVRPGVAELEIDWPGCAKRYELVERAADVDLGTQSLPELALVTGSVRVPAGGLGADAFEVRAWIDGRRIASAEPRADGAFELHVPAGRATIGLCCGDRGEPVLRREIAVPAHDVVLEVGAELRVLCLRLDGGGQIDSLRAVATRAGARGHEAVLGLWSSVRPCDGVLVLPIASDEPIDVTLRAPGGAGAFAGACRSQPLAQGLHEPIAAAVGWGSVRVDAGDVRSLSLWSSFGCEVENCLLTEPTALVERVAPGRYLALSSGANGELRGAAPVLVSVGRSAVVGAGDAIPSALSGRIAMPAGVAPPARVELSWIDARGYWHAPVDAAGCFEFASLPPGRFALGLSGNGMLYVELAAGEHATVECASGARVEVVVRRGGARVGAIQQAQLLVAESAASARLRMLRLDVTAAGGGLSIPSVDGRGLLRIVHLEGTRLVTSFAVVEPASLAAGDAVELGRETVRCAASGQNAGVSAPRLLLAHVPGLGDLSARGWAPTPVLERDEWLYAGLPADAELAVSGVASAEIARHARASSNVRVRALRR